MTKKQVACLAISFFVVGLSACTAIDLTRLKAASSNGTSPCLSLTDDVASSSSPAPPPPPGGAPTGISPIYGPLLLPHLVAVKQPAPLPGAAHDKPSFAGYVTLSRGALSSLPDTIANDEVTQAFFSYVVKASASAQLKGAVRGGPPGATPVLVAESKAWASEVDAFPVPAKLSWGQLKKFADKVFDFEFRPTISDPNVAPGAGAAAAKNVFEIYFRAYYEGKFVDRFGKSVQKPQLPNLSSLGTTPVSLTITDAEITAAETVLLEYLFDSIDPTPVLGDAANAAAVSNATKFYPGGTAGSKPTIFDTDLAHYMAIPASGCGVTINNIDVLTDIATAAGDRAAAIGGLTFNSVGGIGFSLGFLGKVSIGDNQTLSALAKGAISRFAMRLSYASAFWLIRDIAPAPGAAPGARPGPPPSYIAF